MPFNLGKSQKMGAYKMRCFSFLAPVVALAACVGALAQGPTYKVGRAASVEEIRAWDISVGPAGKELPPGRGTAQEGAKIFAQRCAKCHGPTGQGPEGGKEIIFIQLLVGGKGTLNTSTPRRTIGSFWPYATTLWDYLNRAMPKYEEGSLKPDEVYALTAVLLYWNGIIAEGDVIDSKSLPNVQMPNRNGFVPARPDWKQYKDCNPNVVTCSLTTK